MDFFTSKKREKIFRSQDFSAKNIDFVHNIIKHRYKRKKTLNSDFHIVLEELVSYFWQIRIHSRYVSSKDILDTLMLYVAIISEFNAFIFEETIVAQFIYGKCITVAEAKDK